MVLQIHLTVKNFDDCLDEQQYAIRKRRATTIDRINLGNNLYGIIIELFSYGKDYWITRNYARYKDYLIYNTPTGKPELSGQVGSVHGTMVDSVTMQPPANGLVMLEGIDDPIEVDEDGNWECEKVPVEFTKIWGSADAHKLFSGTIQIVPNDDIDYDILMEPGDDTIPPEGS